VKIFITGVESFVGKELISQCDKKGIELTGCDAKQPSDNRFRHVDVRSKDISDIIPENVDAVVHLAALSTDPMCRDKGYECFDINVMGTLNLVNASHKRKAKQFVFASTEWVYDTFKENEIKDEDSFINIANHTSEYALSKLLSEQNLKQKYAHGFCPVAILRFGIIYGPRKANWSAVESLYNSVKNTGEITVGALKTGRCFIHVSDIASGIIRSLGINGFNILNLEGDKLITLGDIIETSKKVLNKNPVIVEKNPGSPSIRNVSNLKAKKALNWKPMIDLADGIGTLKNIG
jgi:nucleoside-diphosphate-sugar epimerase